MAPTLILTGLIIFSFAVPRLSAEEFKARALIIPGREAVLSSQISGRIIKMPYSDGQHFLKGKALIELDCRILKAELKKAQMDLEAAIETHAANLRLQKYDAVSEVEVAVSAAKKKRAQANVHLVQTKVQMCAITAPFNGRVVTRKANLYENITPDDKLLEIIEDKSLKLRILIPSIWLRWLEPKMTFTVQIDESGKSYQAKVTQLGAKVNPVNQTLEIEGIITEPHPELLSGMSGTAFFKTASAATVPTED